MGLDIRKPLGLMFLATGALMFAYGLATRGSHIYARTDGTNINLWWGAVMLLFGVIMLFLSLRKIKEAVRHDVKAEPLRRSGLGH